MEPYERIRILEARVKELETLVDRLLAVVGIKLYRN
jgi:hypothetical protein